MNSVQEMKWVMHILIHIPQSNTESSISDVTM